MGTLNSTPQRLGRYQLRYRIAMGGMGGVYLAKATGAGGADKVVAVKLLHEHMAGDEAVVKMFLDEARIASALNHVNVCSTFDFGEAEGTYYLVMEYLEGEPLNRVLKHLELGTDRHPLHPWLVARLLADAAEGLHAAHQLTGSDGAPLNVVHRDVSPHNIFVTYDGVTKVVDFGIARARERSSSTEAGAFKGKFEYAAPEQITGGGVDRRADTWALGVCLWELLTGKRLFARDDYSATARAVMKEPIQPPSTVRDDVPREFDAIIDQALSRNPDARFQTAREFGRALREALAGSGTAIDGPTVEEWLEALFPGDRAKRQQLSATVRSAGPDALLETVPSALKISDTSTGSKRNFKSQSGGRAASSSQRLPQVGSQPGRTGSQSGRTGSQSGRTGSQSGRTGSQSGRTGSQSGRTPLAPSGVEGTLSPIAIEPSPPLTPSEVEGPAASSSKGLVVGLIALVVVVVAGAAFVVLRAPTEPEPIAAIDVPPSPRGGEGRGEGKHEPAPVPEAEPVEPVIVDAGATPAPETVVDAGSAVAIVPQPEVIDAGAPTVVAARPVKVPKQPKPTARPALVEPPKQPKPVAAVAPVKAIPGGGQVRFKTPGGVADVYIDGVKAGVTPVILQLSAGKHSFELKVEGFEFGGPKSITVAPAGDYNIEVDLR